MANPMGKSRKVDNPYMTFVYGDWEWRVLKSYQADNAKPYARAFMAVRSPYTFGSWEYGDTYWSDIPEYAERVQCDPTLT